MDKFLDFKKTRKYFIADPLKATKIGSRIVLGNRGSRLSKKCINFISMLPFAESHQNIINQNKGP